MIVPFSPPNITKQEETLVLEVLRSGWLTTGNKTKLLEQRLAAECGTQQVLCVNSGTAALELALRLLQVGPGDEVITTPYTYTATAAAICHTGAKPVFADTYPGSYEMDWRQAEKKLSSKTKAIIVVDVGGVPCDYHTWHAVAESTRPYFCPRGALQSALGRVALIADSAHSFGAVYNGKPMGTVADFTAFSFHAVKNMTTGEGGALTWSQSLAQDEEIYHRGSVLSLHGQTKSALEKTQAGQWEYDIAYPGWKWNMPDLLAAVGLAQLERYPQMQVQRRRCMAVYRKMLQGTPACLLPEEGDNWCSNCHLAMVQLKECTASRRDRIIINLAEAGVAANVHYKPLPLLTAYRRMGYSAGEFPNACAMYEREITLPLFSAMTEEQAERAAKTLLCAILQCQ